MIVAAYFGTQRSALEPPKCNSSLVHGCLIARLKSSLAMKDSGLEQNIIHDSEAFTMKMPLSPGFSIRRQGSCDLVSSQTNFRQSMGDVGNIEVVNANATLRQKKPNFDLQDLLASNDSLSWPDSISRANFQMGDERETVGGEWIDKVVVNNNNSVVDWEGESAALPDFFYQRHHSGSSDKQYQRDISRKNGNEFEQQRPRFYSANTDDSDDIDIATSDSSESDVLWQFNVQSINNYSISENGSKIKKPKTKIRESSDTRHSALPVPSPNPHLSQYPGKVGNWAMQEKKMLVEQLQHPILPAEANSPTAKGELAYHTQSDAAPPEKKPTPFVGYFPLLWSSAQLALLHISHVFRVLIFMGYY
ncbi:hypothetical protein ABZP36_005085 [Zizania latifolia]